MTEHTLSEGDILKLTNALSVAVVFRVSLPGGSVLTVTAPPGGGFAIRAGAWGQYDVDIEDLPPSDLSLVDK